MKARENPNSFPRKHERRGDYRAFVIGFLFILSPVFCLLYSSSIRYYSRAHHHAKGETYLYGPFRAILPAGAAMPAFLRILHKRFVLLFIHINHIQRAGVFTVPASGAEFLVDDWRHCPFSFTSSPSPLPAISLAGSPSPVKGEGNAIGGGVRGGEKTQVALFPSRLS
jgi:hypothetical protein